MKYHQVADLTRYGFGVAALLATSGVSCYSYIMNSYWTYAYMSWSGGGVAIGLMAAALLSHCLLSAIATKSNGKVEVVTASLKGWLNTFIARGACVGMLSIGAYYAAVSIAGAEMSLGIAALSGMVGGSIAGLLIGNFSYCTEDEVGPKRAILSPLIGIVMGGAIGATVAVAAPLMGASIFAGYAGADVSGCIMITITCAYALGGVLDSVLSCVRGGIEGRWYKDNYFSSSGLTKDGNLSFVAI